MKQNYDSIDFLKFVAALFVVSLHSDPLLDISPLANRVLIGVGRLAVPIFFIATGFFLFKSKPFNGNVIKKYVSRIGILYLAWFIVELPITIFNRFNNTDPIFQQIFTFVKSFFFTSTFSGSWFLASCVFCTILFYNIYKRFPSKGGSIIITISLIAYLLCVGTSAWGNLMDIIGIRECYNSFVFWFAKPYTSILVGIPYFALGKYIADHESQIYLPNFGITLILLALLMVEVFITYRFQLTNSTDCYLMLLPCAYCIFVYFLKWKLKLTHPIEMRKTSTIVFFSQFIWLFMIEFAEWYMDVVIPQFAKFMIAVLLCLFTSAAIITLQKRQKFNWLKFFY